MRFGELDLLALLPFGPTAIRARVHRFSASFCLAGNIRQPSEKRAVVKYSYPSDVLIISKESRIVACRPERAEGRFAAALQGLRQLLRIAALAAHESRPERHLLRFRQRQLSRDSREYRWAFNSQGTGAQDAVFVHSAPVLPYCFLIACHAFFIFWELAFL